MPQQRFGKNAQRSRERSGGARASRNSSLGCDAHEDRHPQGAPRGRAPGGGLAGHGQALQGPGAGAGGRGRGRRWGRRSPTRPSPTPGPTMADDPAAVWDSEIVLKVQRPDRGGDGAAASRASCWSACSTPTTTASRSRPTPRPGCRRFAMELLPRTTRGRRRWTCSPARPTSPATGPWSTPWRAYSRVLPMMMTAAGTVTPAKVFVVGAGVAGLQAIATARRMGAVVTATDVRPGGEGGDREPGRQVRGLHPRGRGHQGRLRAAADGRGAGRAGEDGGRAPQGPGHRRHHRRRSRAARRRGSSPPRWCGR